MPAPASASVAAGRGVYVTGTDTGVGKSVTTAALLAALNAAGVRAIGMKPVASGSEATPQGLRNADAELLRTHSAGTPAYADVNPCTLVPPIAPHIAAHEAGVSIALASVQAAYARLAAGADRVLVEGVNLVKKHTRPNPAKQIKGGIAEREAPIHVSNVMILTSGGIATRIGIRIEGEGPAARRTRIARKTGEALDKKG